MNDTLVEQGISLMLYGMGTVFVFLTLLVGATSLMSHLVARFFPARVEPPPEPLPFAASAAPVPDSILKVLQAAVDQHRGR